jgi:ferredoxin
MPKITFIPGDREFEVDANAKILAVARKHKLPMRFGCAACQCGTCAVEVRGKGMVSPMAFEEKALLQKIGLKLDGSIRLGCRARLLAGELTVDLSFQDKYSPDRIIGSQ